MNLLHPFATTIILIISILLQKIMYRFFQISYGNTLFYWAIIITIFFILNIIYFLLFTRNRNK